MPSSLAGLTQKKGHKRRAKNSVVVVLCWWLLWLLWLLEDATQLPATSAGEAFFGSALPCDGGTSCIGGKCGCLRSGWSKGDPQIPEEICTGAKTLGGDKNCSKMFQEFLRNFWPESPEAPGGETKSLGFVDLVEFQKFQEHGKSLDARVAHVLPSGNMSFMEVTTVKSRGVWDFLQSMAASTQQT